MHSRLGPHHDFSGRFRSKIRSSAPPFYARHNIPGPPLLRRQVSTDRKMPARSFTPGGHIPSFSNSKNPLFRCLFILFFVFLSLYLLLCILLSVSFTRYSFVQLSWLLSGAFPVLLTALYRPVPHPRLPVLRTFLPPFRHKGNPVLHYRALHNLKAVGIQRFLHFLCFGIYDPGADKKRARRHQLRHNS